VPPIPPTPTIRTLLCASTVRHDATVRLVVVIAVSLALLGGAPIDDEPAEPRAAEDPEPLDAEDPEPLQAEDPDPPEAEPPEALEDLYARVQPSVVRIHGREASGTGFAVAGGRVATAWHVVQPQGDLVLETADRRFVRAEIAAFDKNADVALLQPASPLGVPELPVRELAPIIGEELVAIGHPLVRGKPPEDLDEGLLEWSLTTGQVSAVGIQRLQTTVSLQPGNSGGPVLDRWGEVVGIAILRVGDFGVTTRSEPLVELMALEHPELPGPRVLVRAVGSAHLDVLPGAELSSRRLQLGVGFGVDVAVARRFVPRARVRFTWMTDRGARGDGERARRLEIVVGAGPMFELPFAPHRPTPPSVEPYGFGGVVRSSEGLRVTTVRFLDPGCDPSTAACAAIEDTETDWTERWLPLVGVGLRFGSATFAGEFELATSPADPLRQLRIGFAFVLGFTPP